MKTVELYGQVKRSVLIDGLDQREAATLFLIKLAYVQGVQFASACGIQHLFSLKTFKFLSNENQIGDLFQEVSIAAYFICAILHASLFPLNEECITLLKEVGYENV